MREEQGWFIAVTAGRWQKHGILEAKAAGLKVLAIDADPSAMGFAVADKVLCMSFADHSLMIQALRDLDLKFAGAVSFCSEVGMTLTAKIREAFDLPGPQLALCERLLDKSIQRKIWKENGVPGPGNYSVFTSVEEAIEEAKFFGFPFIIKPIDSSGSRGVTKIESLNDDIKSAVIHAFTFAGSGKILFETYMDGTEFTVEVFAVNGEINVLAVTEKKKVAGTRDTVARELATPDRPSEVVKKISDAVVAAFTALGYSDGPGHAEIILMKNGDVGMVEVAGRGGGFMVFDKLVPAASGINIARLTVLQAVCFPLEKIIIQQHAVVLRFFPSRPGRIENISGFDEANRIEGVEAAAFASIGDRFTNNASVDGDRMGYILSTAKTPQEAQERADDAEKKIFFDIKNIQ